MRIIIERGKSRYEAVPCGPRCSFARKDGNKASCVVPEWYNTHCTKDCYCPKWWQEHQVGTCNGKFDGLRKLEVTKH